MEMIGPMIGSSSRTPAMTASSTAKRPKMGSTATSSTKRPAKVATPTAKHRTNWPRSPRPKTPSNMALPRAHEHDRAGVEGPAPRAAARQRGDEAGDEVAQHLGQLQLIVGPGEVVEPGRGLLGQRGGGVAAGAG